MKLDLTDRTSEDLRAVLAEKDIRLAPQHRRAIKDELARREVLARRNYERLDLDVKESK